MILLLATKYNKQLAAGLLLSFYIGFVSPLYASARDRWRYEQAIHFSPVSSRSEVPARRSMPVVQYDKIYFPGEIKAESQVEGKLRDSITLGADTAFIGGPTQPEMTAFKSAGTNDMVSLFTGDFSYNIPLLDVGGYPVNIFYSGGITMEQEASWVGLGWNINPGTITRNMRGVPDDFDGTERYTQEQSIKPNVTWGGRFGADAELVGIDKMPKGLKLNASIGFSYNNYLGPALDLSMKGTYSLELAKLAGSEKITKAGEEDKSIPLTANAGVGGSLSSRNGLTINPNISLNARMGNSNRTFTTGLGLSTSYNSRTGIRNLQLYDQHSFSTSRSKEAGENASMGTIGIGILSSQISFAKPSYVPAIRMPVTNASYMGQFQAGFGTNGAEGSLEVEVYRQESEVDVADRVQQKPMVGFIYAQKANGNPDAIMDLTRFNDKEVTPKTAIISVPQYAYDVFSISGEGTGGSIRAYRTDMGYMRDSRVQSKDKSISVGVDAGFPGQVGANFNVIKTPSVSGDWNQGNYLRQGIPFTQKTKLEEHVYFRNPGESSVLNDDQYKLIGGTDLVRFKLGASAANPEVYPVLERFNEEGVKLGEQNMREVLVAQARQKRSQVISFLTAAEAEVAGLETNIRSYTPATANSLPIAADTLVYQSLSRTDPTKRLKHHISELSVLESDGKRYVYGLPVYNTVQKDYTVTVQAAPDASDQVAVSTAEIDINNSDFPASRDGYKLITTTPAYANAFLLTGLLSPDYVDLTGNGVTEDDLGTAVKFNYTQTGEHKWRTPSGLPNSAAKAHFNDGNLTEAKDNKGIISYGERESWYLHSIESKTMIALFRLGDRQDAKGVSGVLTSMNANDASNRRLERIDLYNKADIRKNGNAAKPVKSVFFEYDYSLCGNTPGNKGTVQTGNEKKGKLTLRTVYFSYNGQNRAKKNKYQFDYASSPDYLANAADRWGNYKPAVQNPAALKNSIYPYAKQDNPDLIHANAAAWNLNKILLPSGGQIEVTYESDDYAYVQERPAAVMRPIAFLGREGVATPGNNFLYQPVSSGAFLENDRLYISVQEPCTNKQQVREKYLREINQLAIRLAVNMPRGKEYIDVYAAIQDYGEVANESKIWIQLKKVDGFSPLTLTVLDFLREHLPGQAYEGYSPEGNSLKKFADMLIGMVEGLQGAFSNPIRFLQGKGKARTIVLAESCVRLNVPPGTKKYGGGHRVKKVTIRDNWNKMTGQYTATYGQQYDYTTTEVINGVQRTISSGVASYEPSIGGEENPYQEMLQAADRLPLGPANYEAIELPVLDAFFPAPLVGYSKVTVTSMKSGQTGPNNKKSRSGTGKQVTEFYTARDFPVQYDYTRLDPASDKQEHSASLLGFFKKWSFDSRTISQGFRVILNDMHGKIKSQSAYAETDPNTRISYTAYSYRNTGVKGLDEKFDFVHQGLNGEIKPGHMGIDIELMTDAREFSVKSRNTNVQAQVDWFTIPWIPFVWPTYTKSDNYYRAVTTTKVINYHSIVDKVVVMDKGSVVTTQNLVYDAETGNLVVSKVNNEFDKPIYQTSYPAYWAYSGMGPAYRNIDAVFTGVTFKDGKITAGLTSAEVINTFESGDEIYIISATNATACEGLPVVSGAKKIWALDKNKDLSSLTNTAPDFIFLTEKGEVYSGNAVSFRIIRSGKRNMLGAQLQSFASMEAPEQLTGGKRKMVLGANSGVLNASAMEYREKWQTDRDVIKRYKEIQKPDLPAGPNLIVNGDFSAGNTGFTSRYSYTPSGNINNVYGEYTVRNSPTGWITGGACTDHTVGTAGGMMFMADGLNIGGQTVWSQTVAVEPGRMYEFSLWGATLYSQNMADLRVSINDQPVGPGLSLSSVVCSWSNLKFEWKSEAAAQATIKIINAQIATAGNDFAIDDISFHALAQPACETMEVEDCDGYLERKINPYRRGLLGTFRSHRSLVFYEERVQGQTTVLTHPTDIRTYGAMKNFAPYWIFNTSNNLIPVTTNTRWVWNSEVTRVNARGLELETRDALNIYTAAQYGYAKNLPVAITSNAQSQEAAYTGFEDTDYTEALSKGSSESCPKYQQLYFDKTAVVDQQTTGVKAHTGKRMIKVNAGQMVRSSFTSEQPYANFATSFSNESTKSFVNIGGNVDHLFVMPSQNSNWFPDPQTAIHQFVNFTGGVGMYLQTNIYDTFIYNVGNLVKRAHLFELQTSQYMKISQPGFYALNINANYSNIYSSGVVLSKSAYLDIRKMDGTFSDGTLVIFDNDVNVQYKSVFLCAGVYKVTFSVTEELGVYQQSGEEYQLNNPTSFAYNIGSTSETYRNLNEQNACLYTKPLAGTPAMLNPIFQPPINKKMLLSAWVREQCADPCAKQNYTDGKIQLIYKNADGQEIGSTTMNAAGPVIDGWQKIEKEFIVPAGTASVEVALVNNGSQPVYFDDIRLHPYDANMKSYVYDPVNMRLLAELDANNFASFYEYDEEGGLIRTKAETQEGIKTIKETRSANQKSITSLQ